MKKLGIFTSKFYEKVHNCPHTNFLNPNYYEFIHCNTPYCSGHEEHCLNCGVYITTCKCGSENGMSGWPEKRWRRRKKK